MRNPRTISARLAIVGWLLAVAGCAHRPDRFAAEFNVEMAKHDARVVAIAQSDRTKALVAGRESGEIEIWDTETGSLRHRLNAHKLRANNLSFSADGTKFFSNSYFDDSTKLWDTSTGELLQSIQGRGPSAAAPIPGYQLMEDGGSSSSLRIFDLTSRSFLARKYEAGGGVTSLGADAATGLVAVGTASGTLRVWRMASQPAGPVLESVGEATPYAMANWVIAVHFPPGGKSLYSVARSGAIDEWAVPSLRKIRSVAVPLAFFWTAAFSSKSAVAAVGGTFDRHGLETGGVAVIDLDTGKADVHRITTNLPALQYIGDGAMLLFTEHRGAKAVPTQRKSQPGS